MAVTWIETDVVYSSLPTFKRCIGYEQIGRDGSSATFRVYLKLKVNSSGGWYGYPAMWNITGCNGQRVKGSESWSGSDAYRQFTLDVRVPVGGAGGIHRLEIAVWGEGDGGINFSRMLDLKYSTWNTAPYWFDDARLVVRKDNANGVIISQERTGTENAIKIPENWGQFYLSWSLMGDNEGNSSRYELYFQENDGAWSCIYNGGARNFTHTVKAGADTQGKSYDYYVVGYDTYGERTPTNLDVVQFQKNVLTGASISASGSIAYSTSSITLNWSGAKNTYNNNSFTYKLSSPDITIYNPTVTGSSATLTVYKSGTVPTTPYIKFEDLKTKFKSSAFKGTINITLTTTNAYGSSVNKSVGVAVNLQTNPKAPTSISIGNKVSTSLGSYIIPDRANPTVSWSGASDYLGGALTYDVYYKYGTGSEVLLTSGTPNTSVSVKLPTVTSATALTIKVVAKTTFGATSSATNTAEKVYHYSPPTVSITNPNRTITSFSADIKCSLNSSIPNIAFKTQTYQKGTSTAVAFTGTKYTMALSGLTSEDNFTVTATVNDNTGLSANQVATYKVTPAIPKFSVREKGVGVNCINDGANGVFKVDGNSYLGGTLRVTGASNFATVTGTTASFTGSMTATRFYIKEDTNNNARVGYYPTDKCTYIANASNHWFRLNDNGTIQWRGYPVLALSKVKDSSFYGLNVGNGTEDGWIRTTTNGLIPATPNNGSNGGSSLGTSTWRFKDIYATNLNLNGTIATSGRITTASDVTCTQGGDSSSYLKMGRGGSDVYLYNSKSNRYLQFKDDGKLYISDVLVGDFRFKIGGVSNAWWNSVITIANDGVSEVGRYLDFHQGSNNTSDYNCRLETLSGNLICSGSVHQNSDANLKENIKYIDDYDEPITASLTHDATGESVAFKEFIRDDFKPATFKYKKSDIQSFGFIAQDVADTSIGQLFVHEYDREIIDKSLEEGERVVRTEKTLSFDLAGFTTVVARALQEEIKTRDIEIEELRREIQNLKERV